ncbi:YbaB/EbfC family nucleoid-associated protein [Melissococcus plutonius]|uniref:Nucleoid-associated protein DAT561_1304 n=1 Tax=Melissococcus plutonius TaxID=33970 RepID=A0A2Z5Y3I1_9ENTE|nr:YbaB/EbfC family nucleoid-associated protein [Melissococcus plutonius]MCV2499017.1 YbaB/EbfC family nucleoid-associated protein [Melissococcus plutonius]MCV2500215.1 YbaB/EbfC family nucleoid-associated protein [Melissococcus plutonius]MCV2504153.1 YbaB/EbfC family nucleoid-associated protein [Melissococcus plutonius]MCV2507610.1 YbaB/EbfC family nucleoid-associated protein [Melissococcus plutonius]MCV2519964.1 YbaB/EbfC family nucleoid-associated protein [Melissococcus plutonius]
MMRGMGNMQGMMKQVQKMQKEMAKAQEELNAKEFVGEATNALVKTTFTGDRKLKDVSINKEVVDPDDIEMLEDLVTMAVNDALEKIETETESTMGKYTKGLPGL